MSRAADLSGRKFGRLKALHRLPRGERGVGAWWQCVCACGKLCAVRADNLTTEKVRSCGCLRVEVGSKRAETMRAALSRAGNKAKRTADAFADVFRAPPDYVHIDRPGARVVRGGRY